MKHRTSLGPFTLLLLSWLCTHPALTAEDASVTRGYPQSVKSVIEQRCMVCHGCYDAPCQLKLDDWIGLERGASKEKVYNGARLRSGTLTRLYEDALSAQEWRDKGFSPVLNGEDTDSGVAYRMLQLKEAHPLPTEGPLPDSFDFSLNREQSCPTPQEFDDYASERPLQGMPYGFPELDPDSLAVLTEWLKTGAPAEALAPRPDSEQRTVAEWEAFLNKDDNKSQLMSRYIYEHLFIGNLYFDDLPDPSAWYRLVRSRTPPGQDIDIIASRRPYDDPGSSTFYYRLQQRPTTLLAKRHMPYALNAKRRQRWRALFIERDYEVTKLPDYQGGNAANPFITFEQLPVNSRYRFMLDEAHFTIQAYIKGPVCRGQVALNVIDDHFWVAFTKPSLTDTERRARFLAEEAQHMRLPQENRSLTVTLLKWRRYAKAQKHYLQADAREIANLVDEDAISLDMSLIWDGGPEQNDNASLTVFRHFDSATVVKGLVGQQPNTMWIIDYSLLERIHYLLVAGFDVYGKVGHQLESRLYMDFLRMEGEQNFLRLLPVGHRIALRDYWYRGAKSHVKNFLVPEKNAEFQRESAIEFVSDDPKSELMTMLQTYIAGAKSQRFAVPNGKLAALMASPSSAFSYFPENAFVQVLSANGDYDVYSLIHNSAHSNNAQLFKEDDRRLPDEDTLTVAHGFIGTYPNMFFQITEREIAAFAAAIGAMKSDDDYTALVERFGVRRNAPWFWKLSDTFTAQYRAQHPAEAGLFDLNRYQNR